MSDIDTTRPVLDPEHIGRLVRLGDASGEDLLGQLAGMFVADAHVRVAEMSAAVGRGDTAAVARSAHMLSGCSANLGAVELARLCAAFEASGAAGELTDGRIELDAIDAELDRVRLALHAQSRAS